VRTSLGKPLGKFGHRLRKPGAPLPVVGSNKPVGINYQKIKAGVYQAIAELSAEDKAKMPATGTLPELIVALALIKLKLDFRCQANEMGGKLFLGGATVDFEVMLGGFTTLIRVMGDYWHTMPGRKQSDEAQYAMLHAKGYRVADLWEHDLYREWTQKTHVQFVRTGIDNAA
jgi:hypothetical protein